MQLSPKSPIPAAYTCSLPDDTTLYYVQAVLRDTQSSAILQTVNLTRVSTVPNRYAGSFNPVSDPSGLGRPVDVTISVYTDAAHTSLSPNYQVLQLSYVVLQPWLPTLGAGGSANPIDYELIGKKVAAAMQSEKAEKGDEPDEEDEEENEPTDLTDYGRIADMLSELQESISTVHTLGMGNMRDDMRTNVKDSREEITTNMRDMVAQLYAMLEKNGDDGSTQTQAMVGTLMHALGEMPEDAKTLHATTEKHVNTKLRAAVEEIKTHLSDLLKGKDMHIHTTYESGKRKDPKGEAGFMPQDLLRDLIA